MSIESPSTETPEGSGAQSTSSLSQQAAAEVTVTFPANSAPGATQIITIRPRVKPQLAINPVGPPQGRELEDLELRFS